MPEHRYYKDGDWNAICDICGRAFKASELSEAWDNSWRCKMCWEPRHPQDFLRPILDNQSPPFSRVWNPSLALAFIGVSLSAIATSITTLSDTSFPAAAIATPSTYYYAMITSGDDPTRFEKVQVTNHAVGSNTFTVIRGQLGTLGQAWDGTTIDVALTYMTGAGSIP